MTMRLDRFMALLCVLLIALLSACQLPQWRVFQKTVDAKMAEKPPEQTEAERRGAKFIEIKSAVVEADPAAQVQAIHAVAVPLSASLGEPKQPVALEDKDAIIAELRKGLLAEQKKADAWKAFARKYHGTELEGTGVNLFTPTGLLGVAGVVALCVFVPGFLSFLLFVIGRMRGTITQLVQGVEQFAVERPAEAEALKAQLGRVMDSGPKALVKKARTKWIDPKKVEEVRAKTNPPFAPATA